MPASTRERGMRTWITRSRSGHYTVTIRSNGYPGIKVTAEKIPDLESGRWIARDGGKLRAQVLSRVREAGDKTSLPDRRLDA